MGLALQCGAIPAGNPIFRPQLHTGPGESASGSSGERDEPKAEVVAASCFRQRSPFVRQDLVRPKQLVKAYRRLTSFEETTFGAISTCMTASFQRYHTRVVLLPCVVAISCRGVVFSRVAGVWPMVARLCCS